MINKKFKLFECCIPVKGINKGVIMDLQRGNIFIVPNTILQILDKYSDKSIYKLFEDFRLQKEILKKYIRFFYENEIVLISENVSNFPPISKKWEKPFCIDTITIEIDSLQLFKTLFFKNDLNSIGCKNLVIISKTDCIEHIRKILKYVEQSKVELISAFIPYTSKSDQVEKISEKYRIFRNITFYDTKKHIPNKDAFYPKIVYQKESLKKILNQKIKSVDDFTVNIDAYLESLNNNLFYNRKIHIDDEGNVKNSILQNDSFGNIKDTSVFEIISKIEFKALGNIPKDKIEVCKDCEYRYCCPDNRIPVVETNTIYHTTKCNYDPYTNTWNEA